MHNTFLIPKACSHNFSHSWHSWIYSFFGFHVAQLQQMLLNSGKNGGPRFQSKWLFATGSPHILYHFSANNQYQLVSLHIYLHLPSSRRWKRQTLHQFPLHSLYHWIGCTTIHLLCNGHCLSVHESGSYHQAFLQCKDERFCFVMRLFSSYFSFFNSFYPSLNSTHVHSYWITHFEKMFINTKQFLTLNIKVLSLCSFIENAQCLPF